MVVLLSSMMLIFWIAGCSLFMLEVVSSKLSSDSEEDSDYTCMLFGSFVLGVIHSS